MERRFITGRKTRAAGLAVATALLVALAPASAAAAPVEPLGHAGRWITDAEGRAVVLHGFNTVPGNEQLLPRDIGMGPDNARWLRENGFNTIRLGLYYARVEPQPGSFDDAYLDDYLRVQQELAREGIFTLLDMHQDQLHPRYGTGGPIPSRGLPGWMIKDDGFPNTGAPYPSGYLTNPALNRAYDNFWQDFTAPDGVSVQDHFVRGWQRVVARFRDRPRLLGYDLFNEPWPGTLWPTCIPLCLPGGFDRTLLSAFTRKLVAGVRAADARHVIFYEPNLQFDYGAPTGLGDPGDTNAGFTFHDYCLAEAFGAAGSDPGGACSVQEQLPLRNAEAHSAQTGDALLLSEIGFSRAAAERMMRLADERMLSWQFWDYYGDLGTLHLAAAPALIRPYPQVIAGTPRHWSFDSGAKRFELVYSTRRAAGEGAVTAATAPGSGYPAGSKSEVFVPALHFPNGYRVELEGAEVVSKPGSRLLELSGCPGADSVELRLTRGSDNAPPACAAQAAAKLPCLPGRLAVNRRRIGPARLGRPLRTLTRRYRVRSRRRNVARFCVRGGGRFLVATRRARIDLVATTARGHRTRQAAPGRRPRAGRIRGARAVGRGLLVGRRGRHGRVVYGIRRGRVRFLATARRPAAVRLPALVRRLRPLGLAG